ncbi:MAG TPA: hypothetical protein VF423_13415 [Actinomycetes bacterium]
MTLPHLTLPHLTVPRLRTPSLASSRPTVATLQTTARKLSRPVVASAASLPHDLGLPAARAASAARGLVRSVASVRVPAHDGAWTDVDRVKMAAIALLPALLVARTAIDPQWWLGGTTTWTGLAAAAVLAVVGVRWLSRATRRPWALRQSTREQLLASEQQQAGRAESARRLLSGLATRQDADRLWKDFTEATGLYVPPQMRPLISDRMEPDALVRYLTARSGARVGERPLWVVAGVPWLSCLVPAALLVVLV